MIKNPQDALGRRVSHGVVHGGRGVERDQSCAVDAHAHDVPYGAVRCRQHDQGRHGHKRQQQADAMRQRVGEFVHLWDCSARGGGGECTVNFTHQCWPAYIWSCRTGLTSRYARITICN